MTALSLGTERKKQIYYIGFGLMRSLISMNYRNICGFALNIFKTSMRPMTAKRM